jgi:hypothetical protein
LDLGSTIILLHQVQNYEKFGNQQRKLQKNLHVTEKMPIFASSNIKFDYAAECGE